MAHQHILGYSVPENGVEDVINKIKVYLAMIKCEKPLTSLQ